MKSSFLKGNLRLVLPVFFGIMGARFAQAQRAREGQPASISPITRLNKIFSTSNPYGPLGQTREIATSDQLLLFWSEPPQSTAGSYDAYHYQIMNYLNNSALPASQELYDDGTLSGDSVTDNVNTGGHPAIAGNKNPAVLAGDMTGDGYAEVASVWETTNNRVFASAQQVNPSNLSFVSTSLAGELVGTVTSGSSDFDGKISARLADLRGDGKKELVVAWHDTSDNKVHIAIYGWSSSAQSHLALLGSIADMPVITTPAYRAMIAMGTGDFRGDGRDEIALAGFKNGTTASDTMTVYVKIYEADSSFNLVAKGESDFSDYSNVASGTYISPTGLVMATGDLTGDNRDEAVVALPCGGTGPFTRYFYANVYIANPDTSLNNIHISNSLNLPSFTGAYLDNINEVRPPATSLDCGDLNGTGTDQIVLGVWNVVAVFNATASGQSLNPVLQSETSPYTTTVQGDNDLDSADYKYSNTFMKVADLNQDKKDEIVMFRDVYGDNGTNATQSLDVTVLGSTDAAFDLADVATDDGILSETTSDNPDFRRHYSLALGDFNGGSLRLGQPTYFHVDSIVQPLVILNAPPVHFDVFNDTSYDVCGVFNGGSNSGNFVATYNHSTSNTDEMQTSLTSSWGIGASLSGEFSYGAAKVSASLDAHYGQDFSKVQNSSYQTTVSITVGAEEEDEIYAIISGYDLWEYPVIDSNQVKGHVIVTVPGPPQGEWFDTGSWTAFSFVPDHVVGDILSYSTYSDSLENNPYMLEKIKGSFSDGFLLGTATYNWSLSTQDFTSTQVDTTKTFSLNVAADVEVGKEFGGFGASVKAGVSGDYSSSNLTSHTSSVTDALNLSVALGKIDMNVGEDQYTVTPYAYWGTNGALVIDYAVQPSVSGPGGTDTWWQARYGHASDPAFALPYLYWPQEGFTVNDPIKIYQTKEIYCDPSDPSPGDTVTTTVRIHNYSLIPTDSSVDASFYVGDPRNGGTIIKSLTGDSIFTTSGAIPARGSQIFSFRWIAPAAVNARFVHDGDYVHVWGVVDPDNKMKEVHKDDNLGWSILEVPGIVTGVKGKSTLPVSFGLDQNYPNPFNPVTDIGYQISAVSRVKLNVYNILGERVATLVDDVKQPGRYTVRFDGSRLASGVYFYRIDAAGANGEKFVSTKKLVLLK